MLRDWVDLLENHGVATVFAFIGMLVLISIASCCVVEILRAMRGK